MVVSSHYKLHYKESVKKELKKLPQDQRILVVKLIMSLAAHPFPDGAIKLRGASNLYRLRQGAYRIIYQADKDELIIIIIKIGHRREVYRGF